MDARQPHTVSTLERKFRLDASHVATLRRFYRHGFQGEVRGEDAPAMNVVIPFCVGGLVVSEAARQALTDAGRWVAWLRHGQANWGDVTPEEAEANFQALEHGGELRSVFHTAAGVRFTVVTPAHRTHTRMRLVHEA